jgi:hypoxanthine phosphoribosyltransferase
MLISVTGRAKPAFAQGYGGQARSEGLGTRVRSSACVSLAYSGNAQARSMRDLQMQGDIERVLFDGPAIHKRIGEMAARITADYSDRELTVIAILTGSLMFMSDLLRRIPLPLKLDCLSVVSYHGKTQTSGQVIFKHVSLPDVTDRDVLILDDILDTGHTLAAVRRKLETAKPRSIRVCVLLSKRKERARDVDADYIGFEIDDEFVVGYGLDFMERYRNLPYIGVLRNGLLEQPKQ